MQTFFLTVTHDLLHHFSFTYRHTPPPYCLPLVFLSLSILKGLPKPSIAILSSCILSHSHVSDKHNRQASLYSVINRALACSSSKLTFHPLGLMEWTLESIMQGRGGLVLFHLSRHFTPPLRPLSQVRVLLVLSHLSSFVSLPHLIREVDQTRGSRAVTLQEQQKITGTYVM